MKFSIVVPMYNVEKYIEKCINSCINQTYKNYEVLIIDDQSKDNSLSIARELSKGHKFIKIFEQKNSGVSVARNKGITESSGDWILFVDGDDWLEDNALEKLNNTIVENNNKNDVIITSFYTNKSNNDYYDHFFVHESYNFLQNDNIELIKNCICKTSISNNTSSTNVGVPWAKAYKKDFLINNECIFVPGLKRMQDMIFNLKVFELANNVICVNYPTYHYRINEGSVTKKFNSDFDLTVEKLLNEINDFIIEYNLETELRDYYEAKAVKLFIEMIRIQFSPNGLEMSNIKKIKVLKNKRKESIFNKHINLKHQNILSKNEKIMNFLINFKMLWLVYYIYRLKYLLKK